MNRFVTSIVLVLAVTVLSMGAALADEGPALPPGLGASAGDDGGPSLPPGLAEPGADDGPGLPEGLGDGAGPSLPEGLGDPVAGEESAPVTADWWDDVRSFGLRGFLDVRAGLRLQDDANERDLSLGEARLQLALGKRLGEFRFDIVADFLYDDVAEDHDIDLDRGEGWLDLRQASVGFSPTSFTDVKIGRQILTWGTGDMLFLNDLFPKDWQSFFSGRDTEYLKAPSDAVKLGIFTDAFDVDIVYTPQFDTDRYITGERISYCHPALGRRAGRHDIVDADRPDDAFSDDEIAIRISRPLDSFEAALYGYEGFWKSPAGMDPMTGRAVFPKLGVYGASLRGPLAGGILNAEVAYYDSRDDRRGDDPFVDNSQLRVLVGFERDLPEVAHDLTVGVQWYLESMREYDEYRSALPPGATRKDANRQVVTLRVTKRLMSQTLDLSLFAYMSPTDSDAYVRLAADYQIDDHWNAFVGANVFVGADDDTFFGQFERNTNAYLGVRWSF